MIRYADLFAGCGGLSEGFEQAGGFSGVLHVEWKRAPAATLIARLQEAWLVHDAHERVLACDVRSLAGMTGESVSDLSVLERWERLTAPGSIDLVIGGPPCQAYSVAGRIRDANGMRDDYRNFLFEAYVKVLEKTSARAFVFENVPGMLSAAPGGVRIAHRIRAAFEASGFAVSQSFRQQAVFDAADFGVAQRRRRIIIAGFSREYYRRPERLVDDFYRRLAQRAITKHVSAKSSIGDLPPIFPVEEFATRRISHQGSSDNTDPWHEPRFHNRRDIEIFRLLAADRLLGSPKYNSTDALKKLYFEQTGRWSNVHKYHVIDPELPSNLIPAHLYKDGLRHIHWDPEQARSLTPREAARLQSFPDDFPFQGPRSAVFEMIGNAVPPVFSRTIAQTMYDILKDG